MRPDIDIVIPTVLPQRAELIGGLLSQLQGWSVRVEVHRPDEPPWARVERVFGRPNAGYVVQFEDDVTLAPGAIDRIVDVVTAGRPAVYSFFSRDLGCDGLVELPPGRLHMTQAIAMHWLLCDSFARYFPGWKREHPEIKSGIGRALGAWARREGVPIMVHYPSLVQHLPVASTISRRPRDRQSPTFEVQP
jgi:hypothetical protein